ncbi:MAG: peptidoglycan DD-metalloendopeptidase family protein [Bacteroidales bacterium]|nr:peptidoglycan DD-metalloendopeptidase family protein [Bacteroidales bacterium]
MLRYLVEYVLSFFLLCIVCATGSAQNTRRQEEQKARLEREIAIIDRQLSDNASKSEAMLSNLTLIRKKISNRKELVSRSDRQIRMYNDSIYLTQIQINRLNERIELLSEHYSRLIASAYKNRDARIWYMYMLASDNLGQAFRRYGYFRNLSSHLNDEAQRIRVMQDDLSAEKERLGKLKKEAEVVKSERVRELEKLRKDEAEADGVVKKLSKNRKTYQNQLAAKKKQVLALNKEIERIVAEAVKGKGTSKPAAPVDLKLDAEFSKNKEKLPWPAEGPVVARFGRHYHPVYKNLELPPNNGVDIALARDTQVKAIFDGEVRQVMVMPGYNQCVLIQHGNYFSFYCRLKKVNVKAGDKIKTGEPVGYVDTINGHTLLHFEVWQGTKPQNPENWLR